MSTIIHVNSPSDRAKAIAAIQKHGYQVDSHEINPHAIRITQAGALPSADDESKMAAALGDISHSMFTKNNTAQTGLLRPRIVHHAKIDGDGKVVALAEAAVPVSAVGGATIPAPLVAATPKQVVSGGKKVEVNPHPLTGPNAVAHGKFSYTPRRHGVLQEEPKRPRDNHIVAAQRKYKPVAAAGRPPAGVSSLPAGDHASAGHAPAGAHANAAAPRVSPYFKPSELASIYQYPAPVGSAATIAIIELGGGYNPADLTYYWKYVLGFSQGSFPNVSSVSIDGARNNPGQSDDDYEVVLDIEVVGGMYAGCNIIVYFAPNTLNGFYDAIQNAISNSNVSVVSISWGAPELTWGNSALQSFNQLFSVAVSRGITVYTASGDNGPSDGYVGLNADFPSSSPNVVACGGTNLTCPSRTYAGANTREVAWYYGGGGRSAVFAPNAAQVSILRRQFGSVGTRAVPDVAGVADSNTGIIIYLRGSSWVVGGTSAVAPMWAALHGLTGVKKFAIPMIYANYLTTCFHDITAGSNSIYTCKTGYDLLTGVGSPNGGNVKAAFNK